MKNEPEWFQQVLNRTKQTQSIFTMNEKQTALKQAFLTLHALREEQHTTHRLTRTALKMAMDIVEENIEQWVTAKKRTGSRVRRIRAPYQHTEQVSGHPLTKKTSTTTAKSILTQVGSRIVGRRDTEEETSTSFPSYHGTSSRNSYTSRWITRNSVYSMT